MMIPIEAGSDYVPLSADPNVKSTSSVILFLGVISVGILILYQLSKTNIDEKKYKKQS